MKKNISKNIGDLVLKVVNDDFIKSTENNYDLMDYVNDFKGSEDELIKTLIKIASKLL